MLPVRSVLVDFDGTACLHDVAEHLLLRYGDPSWPWWDEAWARGEVGARQGITAQAAMLDAPTDELVAYSLEHCPLDPTFAPFVDWARSIGAPVTLVSDGFGFYIRPLLHAHGVMDVPVITNDWDDGAITFRLVRSLEGLRRCPKASGDRPHAPRRGRSGAVPRLAAAVIRSGGRGIRTLETHSCAYTLSRRAPSSARAGHPGRV
jgi:hypothetical protein